MTGGSSAQPSVLPNSVAENPVGASYDDVAEADPAFCWLKVPEVLPPQPTRPPIRVGTPIFLSLIPLSLWVILQLTSPSFGKMMSVCGCL